MLSGQYASHETTNVYVVGNLNRYSKGKGRRQQQGLAHAKRSPIRGRTERGRPLGCVTIAEALEINGYATGAHWQISRRWSIAGMRRLPENAFRSELAVSNRDITDVFFAKENKSGGLSFQASGAGDFDRWRRLTPRLRGERVLPESRSHTQAICRVHLAMRWSKRWGNRRRRRAVSICSFCFSYAVHGPGRLRPGSENRPPRSVSVRMAERNVVGLHRVHQRAWTKNSRILAAVEDPTATEPRRFRSPKTRYSVHE